MRCPACGWSNTLKNYPRKNKELLSKLDEEVIEHLRRNFLTSLNDLTSYTLLKACTDTTTEVINHSVNIWERKNLSDKGYDVYYFIGILRNEGKKIEEKKSREQKRLDRLPPTIT